MNDQRALSVLYSFPHVLGTAGIGTTAWHQVNGLAEAGHRVTVATASIRKPLPPSVHLIRTLSLGRVRVPHRAFGTLDRALRWHDLVVSRLVARSAFDVIHVWPLASTRTLLAARNSGIPSFREAPNTHTEHAYRVVAEEVQRCGGTLSPDNPHRADPRRLAVEQREWELASAILVPSESVADSFLDAGFDDSRLARHRYGCEVPEADLVHPPRSAGEPLTALFAGRCEPRKGLHHALDAWLASTASKSGRLLICGEFAPGYAELLGARLRHPSVDVQGFRPNLDRQFRLSDVLLLPSLEEGSALVTYEAQVRGCVPLVSTATGAWLTDGRQGLLHEPGDVDTLRRQLDRLDADRDYLAALRQSAIDHTPELTWDAATTALERAYRSRPVLPRSIRDNPPTEAAVAVLICTRDRPALLEGALRRVEETTAAAAELVVVDSASTGSATREVVARTRGRYVRAERPGLSIARNVALSSTERELVVFTDDDCEPQTGWITQMLPYFADPRVAAVTGRMAAPDDLLEPGVVRSRYRRVRDGLDAGHGAVMAFRRQVVLDAGGFDPVLGAGRRLAGAEDLDIFCRLIADGWTVVHEPAMVVRHVNERIGDDYRRLLAGYGRGLGGLLGKTLRTDPVNGASMLGVTGFRLVRRTLRSALRRSDQVVPDAAMLVGLADGLWSSARFRVRGHVFVDSHPPAEIPPAHLPDSSRASR